MKKYFLITAALFAALSLGFVSCENPDDEPGFSLENVEQDDANSDKENAEGSTDGDGTTPSTPEKPTLIATGDVTNLAENSATFWGRLNADTLWAFPNVKWGVEYAYDREAMSQHKHQETTKVNCTTGLQGANMDEFSVTIDGLLRCQTIYYSAYILINDMKYVYGELDSVHIVKLTVESNSSSYGTVTDCSGYYNYGFETTITATPNNDYIEFVQWSDGNTENPRTVTITSDVTYIAEFNISYTSNFTPAAFSVSSTKQVYFSSANLQYHPANDLWRFAPSQLDYIGDGNENISSTYNGWLDLFGWGTGSNPTNTSQDYTDYSTFINWGTNQIGADAPNTWRTLTKDEWLYLLDTRTNAFSLRGVAQVNGVNGWILLPDSWTGPAGITFKSGFHSEYSVEAYGQYQTFTADQWSKMEAAGAVFLPAAGDRDGYVYGVGTLGRYWSSTMRSGFMSTGVYCLSFCSSGASMDSDNRCGGRSVRLVQDL